jgi:AcrR family transcriptional regulator
MPSTAGRKLSADAVTTAVRGPGPIIRRPRAGDAVEIARDTFLAGKRVEMGVIAAQLDVSQATIYRWLGSREQLIERVLDQIVGEFLASTKAAAQGEGNERVLDFVRRFMEATVSLEPVRAFVKREPQLALRVILGEAGVIRRSLRTALAEAVSETRSESAAAALDGDLDALVEVGVALEWATFAIGDKPQIDHAIRIMRVMLEAGGT